MGFKDQMADEVSRSGRESLDQYDFTQESVYVKFHPTTAVTGTFPEGEGNPVKRFWDMENENGRKDQGYLGLLFDNPGVERDEDDGTENTIILHNPEDSTEYRIFNPDDKSTEVEEDGDTARVFYNTGQGERIYRGDVVDEIDADRAIIVVDGTAAKSVARRIDVNGAQDAEMGADGRPNGGLIEYPPDDVDAEVRSRYARNNPELREDLLGEEVTVMVAHRTEVDDSYAELVEEGERNEMKYFMVFDSDGPVEPTTGEPIEYTWLDWRYDPEAEALPEQDQDFIKQYVEEGHATDEETIVDNIEANADGLSDDPDVDRIVASIQAES